MQINIPYLNKQVRSVFYVDSAGNYSCIFLLIFFGFVDLCNQYDWALSLFLQESKQKSNIRSVSPPSYDFLSLSFACLVYKCISSELSCFF